MSDDEPPPPPPPRIPQFLWISLGVILILGFVVALAVTARS